MVRRSRRRRAARRQVNGQKQVVPATSTNRASTRRRRARRRRGAKSSGMLHPFISCVYGPVDMPSMGHGVPDGANYKTIVLDHRQTIVCQPDGNGNISFALHPSAYGSIGLGYGIFQNVSVNSWNNAGVSEGWLQQSVQLTSFSSNNLTGAYPLIPHTEWLAKSGVPISGQGVNSGAMEVERWRVVSSTARCIYTGDTFHDSGIGVSCRLPFTTDTDRLNPNQNAGYPNWLPTVGVVAQYAPADFVSMANTAGARLFAARDGCDIINVPASFDFQMWKQDWAAATVTTVNTGATPSVGYLFPSLNWYDNGTTTVLTAGPAPGLGNADTTFVQFSGIQTGQTIVVEARTCIEYTLGFTSPMMRMAEYAAEPEPEVVRAVHQLGRTLPSSKPPAREGWLGQALAWYGSTMKSIIGKAWEFGGEMLSAAGAQGAGALVRQAGTAIEGRRRGRQSMNQAMRMLAITG